MISDPGSSDIEVEANQGFERIWNRAQLGLQVLICAGFVGVLGDGWLSRAARGLPSAPIRVDYLRLMRANAPTAMVVKVNGRLPKDPVILGVGSERLDRASIGSVQPAAATISTTERGAFNRPLLNTAAPSRWRRNAAIGETAHNAG